MLRIPSLCQTVYLPLLLLTTASKTFYGLELSLVAYDGYICHWSQILFICRINKPMGLVSAGQTRAQQGGKQGATPNGRNVQESVSFL